MVLSDLRRQKRKTEESSGGGGVNERKRYSGTKKAVHKTTKSKLRSAKEESNSDVHISKDKKKAAVESKKRTKKIKGSSFDYMKSLYLRYLEEQEKKTDSVHATIPDSCVVTRIPSSKIEEKSFLESAVPDWSLWLQSKESSRRKAAPFVLLIAASATRSIQLNRSLSSFKTSKCISAKLFSKHMKKEWQADFLKSRSVHWGFGTPNRMKTLVDEGSLCLSNLRVVLLDFNHRDQKQRRLIDMPETRNDTFHFLVTCVVPLMHRDENPVRLILL